ncbi:MAG: NADH-quinone oxidoreductase subunit K [Candidatus Omnitrophica bacterium]|nr:NADH-quinone oxidoreductase subunit K [Candidatus Omnitrophota bacterium]
MYAESLQLLWPFLVFVLMLLVIGIYCLFATLNLIRALIGVEILIKAVTLLLIVVGYITDHVALTQALVITLIVIEAVVMAVSVGVVLGIHTHKNSLDIRNIRNMKG